MQLTDSPNLQAKWDEGYAPLVSGIAFASGKVNWLNLSNDKDPATGRLQTKVSSGGPTSLLDLSKEGSLRWVHYITMKERCFPEMDVCVHAGGGSFGGDGFVAVCDMKSKALKWIAFFDSSNPFSDFSIKSSCVIAKTTLDETWSFSLQSPSLPSIAKVSCPELSIPESPPD